MKILAGALLACMAFITTSAVAQCATGVNTGGGNCIPPDAPGMPGYQPEQGPPEPVPIWQDRWGAIVIDDTSGDVGLSSARPSKSDAIQAATRDCEARGARQCAVALQYYNSCAALAWGKGVRGTASDNSEEAARSEALKFCTHGGSNCKVVYSGCSKPARVQ